MIEKTRLPVLYVPVPCLVFVSDIENRAIIKVSPLPTNGQEDAIESISQSLYSSIGNVERSPSTAAKRQYP